VVLTVIHRDECSGIGGSLERVCRREFIVVPWLLRVVNKTLCAADLQKAASDFAGGPCFRRGWQGESLGASSLIKILRQGRRAGSQARFRETTDAFYDSRFQGDPMRGPSRFSPVAQGSDFSAKTSS